MKLLFHIILFFIFIYVNSQVPNGKTINGCGNTIGYDEPQKAEDCKDILQNCCYISLKNGTEPVKSFCFPSLEKISLDDVKDEILSNTGYTADKLECFDFSERIRYKIGYLLLIIFVLI